MTTNCKRCLMPMVVDEVPEERPLCENCRRVLGIDAQALEHVSTEPEPLILRDTPSDEIEAEPEAETPAVDFDSDSQPVPVVKRRK